MQVPSLSSTEIEMQSLNTFSTTCWEQSTKYYLAMVSKQAAHFDLWPNDTNEASIPTQLLFTEWFLFFVTFLCDVCDGCDVVKIPAAVCDALRPAAHLTPTTTVTTSKVTEIFLRPRPDAHLNISKLFSLCALRCCHVIFWFAICVRLITVPNKVAAQPSSI